MTSTAELAGKYIEEHPSIQDCLKNDLVNYSKLSRKIAKEIGVDKKTSVEAILVACRRYVQKTSKESIKEKEILSVLKKSSLEIKNKILVAIIDKKIYLDNLIDIEKEVRSKVDTFYAVEGTKVFTIITTEKYQKDIETLFKKNLVKVSNNYAMITLKSPEDLENTPGIVGYLYGLFAQKGINIVETMSCWTDTIFVIDEQHVAKVMEFLKF